MATAILVDEREFERDYKISDGRIITIKISDDLSEVSFWEGQKLLGSENDFVFIDECDDGTCYLLSRMYIKPKGFGLGRAALKFFIDITGATVYTRSNDGITRDDGSHLTEDAPGFVFKMIDEGLIQPHDNDEYLDFEDE